MLKIGLTGGIGSGKSTVAAIFLTLGIPVFDADKEAKRLMETDEVRLAVQQQFGRHVYTQGKLNRQVLSQIVFSTPHLLNKLNAIIHPVTITAAKTWMESHASPYVIKEAALMFEAGSANNLDYVIGVSAPEAVRLQRVMQRDNTSRQQVLDRMNRQIDETIKMRLCDFILVNDEQQLLVPQVLTVHEKLLSLAEGKGLIK